MEGSGDIPLSAEQGTVALLSNTDQSSEREYERDQGLLWFAEEDLKTRFLSSYAGTVTTWR